MNVMLRMCTRLPPMLEDFCGHTRVCYKSRFTGHRQRIVEPLNMVSPFCGVIRTTHDTIITFETINQMWLHNSIHPLTW